LFVAIAVGDVGGGKPKDKVRPVLGEAAIMDRSGTVHRSLEILSATGRR